MLNKSCNNKDDDEDEDDSTTSIKTDFSFSIISNKKIEILKLKNKIILF